MLDLTYAAKGNFGQNSAHKHESYSDPGHWHKNWGIHDAKRIHAYYFYGLVIPFTCALNLLAIFFLLTDIEKKTNGRQA